LSLKPDDKGMSTSIDPFMIMHPKFHRGASWHEKQYCQLEFLTLFYKRMIFYFFSVKIGFFLWSSHHK
jgi:hypothetical protein